jgi:hypothetical protein
VPTIVARPLVAACNEVVRVAPRPPSKPSRIEALASVPLGNSVPVADTVLGVPRKCWASEMT